MSGGEGRSGFVSGVIAGLVLGLVVTALVALALGVFDDGGTDTVAEARSVIEANYFEDVPGERLDESSIRGMVDDLRNRYGDQFSHYFSAKQLEEFRSATSGEFEGVGLAVTEVAKGLRVSLVYPDTPAERAGIKEADVITAVDGRSIAGVSSDVATTQIKGPPGTTVELKLLSPDRGKTRELTVERASVRIPAVTGALRKTAGDDPVAYVRFSTFSEGAHGELRDEIVRLYERGAEGLVLDLRANGGGLLNEAILCSSIFVEDGVIVSTRSRTQGERDYDAEGEALDERPMVVLVNRDSASAAEILAAALQVYDLATVVGTRTFGKGTFQEVIPLPAGGALDLTIGQYLTADGTSLAGEGIPPQVRAEDDPKTEREDEALDEALAVLEGELAGSPQ